MQATPYNEGMHTLMDDFAGKYRRINDLMTAFRGVITLPLIDRIIDKFCKVVVPYPGGPIYATLLSHYELNWGSSAAHDWAVAIDLDRGVTGTDVVKILLDDIEASYEEITGQSADANDKADYRLIDNAMAVLGFGTCKVPEIRVEVDPLYFEYIQFHNLFTFVDDQGVGADTMEGYPVADALSSVIHRSWPDGYTPDYLDFCGILPNAVKASEVGLAADNVIYGVLPVSPYTSGFIPCHRVYTPEDGWFSTAGVLDLTAADTLQDYIWDMPWVTKHIYGSKAIGVQDPEEDYWVYGPSMPFETLMPHDHLGEGLFLAYHKSEYGGFDVPVAR
jgi:hypothetical protein